MGKQNVSFVAVLVVLGILMGMVGCSSNSPDAVFHRGVRAYQESDPIGASLYFEDFIKKFPTDERVKNAYSYLANCYYNLKDYANMRAVFEEMKNKFPDTDTQIACDFQIGSTYYSEGFYDKAINKFSEIADATSNPRIRVQAFMNLAGVYARQTQAATAENYYDRIFNIAQAEIQDPTEILDVQLMALSGKAEIFKASAEFEKARTIYKQTLDIVGNATDIAGIENVREKTVISWVETWREAGDFISSVTMYDKLQDHPYIQKNSKPWLIIHKIEDLQALFNEAHLAARKDQEPKKETVEPEKFTPEEVAVLVNENQRLIKDFADTDFAINARVAVAQLIRDTTPTEAETYFNDAIALNEKYITTPPDPQRPLVALFQIADAYIRYDKFPEAKQTLERIKQSYSQVPQAMQRVSLMLQYMDRVEQERAKASDPSQAQPSTNPDNTAQEAVTSAT